MSDRILDIMNRYAGFELTNDGIPEIQQLRYVAFESPAEQPPTNGRLVLVLVEPRILEPMAGLGSDESLLDRLERYKGDLRAEGMHSRFIEAEVYDGDVHKDGSILLALRRFLREVRQSFARLEGVVLVGSFPESSLVRRWCWASPHKCSDPVWDKAGSHLAIVPEPVSTRSEIVLADLNGNWEQLYHRQISIPAWIAEPGPNMAAGWRNGEIINDCVFESNEYVTGQLSFNDCFYVDDANFTILERNDSSNPPKLRVRVRTTPHNPEVAAEDRNSVNVIARPDICVSRINARNIAYDPDPTKTGNGNQGLLDANGNPQTIQSSDATLLPGNQVHLFTEPSPTLERRLYNRYFDRNHRFRVGAWSKQPFRPAVISGTDEFKASSYVGVLKEAATDFAPEVLVDDASALDYVNFLKTPAPLKYIIAHSSPWNSAFDGDYEATALQAACGGAPFRWHRDGQYYRPSFEDQGKAVDWFIHRTLFHYHTLDDAGASLTIHGGCDVNTVPGTNTEVYGDMDYARWQNAEGILFGSNAVAVLSRAKTFNDAPWGMGKGLKTGLRANFGNAWRGYYDTQAGDAALAPIIVQNKRAYFWSITGDWTLRLRNNNGVGILALHGDLEAEAIQPNQAWIDGWNLDSARDRVVGMGDFEGQGRSSFVVTSNWGMGILKHDGKRWRQLVGAPRDTWFGAWRWDARVNKGRDVVRAVENFAGSGHAEILVTSSWGLGVLRRVGSTMHATRAYKSGTRIGGWVYDASNNAILGTGDFDGDGRHEVLIRSPWGVGVLTMHGNTHRAMHKSGERLGGWVLDVTNNSVPLIGDFDGDGRAELLIRSPWGIGVLELSGGKLVSVAMHKWGTDLGHGYQLHANDGFRVCGRLRGLGRDEILVTRSDAWFVLSLSGGKLSAVLELTRGQRIGGWNFDPRNNTPRFAAPLAGNNHEQLVLTSPWGIGVLEFDDTHAPVCKTLHPYEAMLGDWYLRSTDVVLGAANFSGTSNKHELLVLKRRP